MNNGHLQQFYKFQNNMSDTNLTRGLRIKG